MRALLCICVVCILVPASSLRAQDDAPDAGPVGETPDAAEVVSPEPVAEPQPVAVAAPTEATSDAAVTVSDEVTPAAARALPDVEVSFIARSGGETPVDPAAPALGSGVPWLIELAMQVFAQYELTVPQGADWFHEIDVTRTWLSTAFRVENAIGRVLLEGTRAGGDGSLIGVGGDSLVVRFREAWLGYRLLDLFELRAGLIPQLTTPALTELWQTRAIREIGLRQFELMQPADLGASLRFDIPQQFGFVSVAYLSGEGYRSRELNRGKTLEIAAQVHPLAFLPEARPLVLTLAYQNGSTGTGAARADRFVGGVAWSDPRWGVGLELAYALGLEDRSDREGLLVDAWGRVEPIEHLLIAARYAHFYRNLTMAPAGDEVGTFTGSVGTWIVEAIRIFLAFDVRVAGDRARTELPGFEAYALRVVFEGNLGARFEGSL